MHHLEVIEVANCPNYTVAFFSESVMVDELKVSDIQRKQLISEWQNKKDSLLHTHL